MRMKELDNSKFTELLRMMAERDESGNSEVLREACRRIEALEIERDAVSEELLKNRGVQGSGRIWVAPCEMGTTLHRIVTRRHRVTDPEFSFVNTTCLKESNFFRVVRDFGKTVFLTKAEADVRLAEIRSNSNRSNEDVQEG